MSASLFTGTLAGIVNHDLRCLAVHHSTITEVHDDTTNGADSNGTAAGCSGGDVSRPDLLDALLSALPKSCARYDVLPLLGTSPIIRYITMRRPTDEFHDSYFRVPNNADEERVAEEGVHVATKLAKDHSSCFSDGKVRYPASWELLPIPHVREVYNFSTNSIDC